MKKETILSDRIIKRPKTWPFRLLMFISLALSVFPFLQRSEGAAIGDYCVTPPFIVGGVKPNLLFMLDNSASMYDLIYSDSGSSTRTPSYCYDQTFKSTNSYTGYFDQTKIYSYDLVNSYFFEDASGIPASCDHRIAGQLCINKTASGSTYTLTKFMASGKYLNWLTASKFDVQKKVLTGGKYDTVAHMLMPETRGCIGRKFIKEALSSNNGDYIEGGTNTSLGITFAVKGPDNEDNPTAPSPGGQTYLSIYFGDYNQGICQPAINAYSDPTSSNAEIKKSVDDCLSYTTEIAHCALDLSRTCSTNSDCDNADGRCKTLSPLPTCSSKHCFGGAYNGQACTKNSQCQFSTCDLGRVGTVCGYRGGSWDNTVCNSNVGPCQTSTSTTSSKTQVAFAQTIQACWAMANGTPIGIDEVNTIKNQCTDIYDELFTCDGGANSGKLCTVATAAADCPGAGVSCVNGPAAIHPGNPAYICSNTYTGECATTADAWLHATWNGSYFDGTTTYTGDDCITQLHIKFCNDITVPPVIDPTDDPSDTTQFDNLPAIINDIGLESQLNQPFAILTVKNKDLAATPVAPSGLLNDFSGAIRMGAMSFDFNGSASECGQKVCSDSFTTTCVTNADCTGGGTCITPVPCPKVCSSSPAGEIVTCSTKYDCPDPDSVFTTCDATTPGTSNLDGAKVIAYISDDAGTHSTGLINTIDNLKARSWTPFSEGFYNAIGYFARTNAYTNATGTSRTDLRINTTDFDASQNPSQFKCQENNILIISDGQPTAEKQSDVTSLVARYNDGDTQTGFTATCPKYQGTMDLDDLAWLAKNRNIKTFAKDTTSTTVPATASEQITTYVVYTGPSTTATTECDPKVLMNHTAINGGTTLYNPQNPEDLTTSLRDALNKISAKTASGTAASVLASGEGSGANLIQALFYPKRKIGTTDISWTGVLQNMWYYLDPNLGLSSIREDTDSDQTLKLRSDYIIDFNFSSVTNETTANLYADANGDGTIDSGTPTSSGVAMDNIKYLWEAGRKLFVRSAGSVNDPSSGERIIYTNLDDDSTLDAFDTTNVTNITPFLLPASDSTNNTRLIKYIRGIDDVNADGSLSTADTIDGSQVRKRTITLTIGGTATTGVWKLSDIVNSTPKIASWIPLNLYDKAYNDTTYRDFVNTSTYKNRNAVFTGANDGMLHAFKLGKLGIYNDANIKATLGKVCQTNPTQACLSNSDCPGLDCVTETDIGKELWGFIPKNALPYLKYLADSTYCHLYYVDATPYIFDASIAIDTDRNDDGTADQPIAACNVSTYANYERCTKGKDSWRTVLIGSMRLGGACRDTASTCNDCAKTPISGTGYSSYFAIDVTDPENPSLMWEYSNPELGMSTTGPAVVRINRKVCSATGDTCNVDTDCTTPAGQYCVPTTNTNGKWFVVLGSGPQGFVAEHQFTGVSPFYFSGNYLTDKNYAKLVVLDLKTGTPLQTINTSIPAAFIGNLTNSTIDLNLDYSDDALYFGYTRASEAEFSSSYYYGYPGAAGTNSTVVLSSAADSTNNAYTGKYIQLWQYASGAWVSRGVRLITAYDGATRTATFTPKYVPSDLTQITQPSTGIAPTWVQILSGWTKGGVLRLVTKDNLTPSNWALSSVIDNIGPVTAGVSKLQNFVNKKLSLFFGTGRYFYKIDTLIDDSSSQQKLFGINEPCFPKAGTSNIDPDCTTAVSSGDLGNASTSAGSADVDGWYINLDLCVDSTGTVVSCSDATAVYRAERVVTDPVAAQNGSVFFTTSSPAADICEYGGASHIWAVRYDTGGSLAGTGILRGKAIVQVSTGAIEEVNLATAFNERENRRTGSIQGLPPSGGLSLVVPPKPIKKILHMKKQ